MTTVAVIAFVISWVTPGMFFSEEVDDCEGEWDESFVDRSDDIGEPA